MTFQKGFHHSEETKKKMSEIVKKRIQEGKFISPNKGKHLSFEHRQKLSLSHIGYINHMKGKHISEDTKRKISIANKGRKLTEEQIKNRFNLRGTYKISKEASKHLSIIRKQLYVKGKMKIWNKGLTKENDERLQRIAFATFLRSKNKKFSEEHKKKLSKSHKLFWRRNKDKFWNNPNWKTKTIEAQLKGLMKRPTSLEKRMLHIIKKNKLPYEYTGNGSFLIGWKNPDFVNVNGEKICVEVANTFHHDENYIKNRTEHFAKYGWKCIVFRTDKLNENEVISKLGVNNE
jgi:very-short-patch-repair endonuclease